MKKKTSSSNSNHFLEFDEIKHTFKKSSKDEYKYNYKSRNSSNPINSFKYSNFSSNITSKKVNKRKNSSRTTPGFFKGLSNFQVLFTSPKRLKIFFILFLALLVYFLYQPLLSMFYKYLFQYPSFAALFSDISREWLNRTLKGLFIMGFFGTFFLISFPSELIFFQYIETSTNLIIIIVTLTLANTLAMILNYGFGKIIGASLLKFLLKDKFEKYQNLTLSYGTFILVFGNVFVGPIEVLAVMFGASGYNFKKYLYIVIICRVLKYLSLIILYVYFPQVIDYIII